jgi:hypothetical protein
MPAAITLDSDGQLHLVHAGPGSLGHWLWNGNRWQPEVPLTWSSDPQEQDQAKLLAVSINSNGKMVVVLAAPTGEAAELNLLYSVHALEASAQQIATKDAPTPTQLPPTITPETPTSQQTPTPQLSSTPVSTVESAATNSQGEAGGNQPSGGIPPLMLALVPVALLLLGVLGFMIRPATRNQDR